MTGWLIVLVVVACYRLTRLVTSDYIAEPVRLWAERRWGEKSKRAYLVTCNWCLSIYIAPCVTVPAVLWPTNRIVWAVLLGLTASATAGLVATWQTYVESTTPED